MGVRASGQTRRAQLSTPWPRAIGDTVGKGVALLLDLQQTAGRLSTRYDAAIEQLNVAQLVREWDKAEATVWPLSALSHSARQCSFQRQRPQLETGSGRVSGRSVRKVSNTARAWRA